MTNEASTTENAATTNQAATSAPKKAAAKKGAATKKPAAPKKNTATAKKPAKAQPKPGKQPKATTAAKPAKDGAGFRPGTKGAKILELISRPKGASLAELMKAANWQAHSVRGFISGALGKKLGIKIESAKREGDGERVYTLSK